MQTTTTPEAPTPTPAPLPTLEVSRLVIRGRDGRRMEIDADGLTVRDADGRARMEIGHTDDGLYGVTLLEPDPAHPRDIRVRAAMEIDAFGTVAVWVDNGADAPAQRHSVGVEAVPLEDYGDRERDAMLCLHDGRAEGTAAFFNAAPARLRRVK